MELLKQRILAEGCALNADVLLVDSFLNHQVDVVLMQAIGQAFAAVFAGRGATRVVTVESSGIAPAMATAFHLGLPLVVCKKQASRILAQDVWQAQVRSFTRGIQYELTLKRAFMPAGERVLLIDDFLASGEAALGVLNVLRQAQAELIGVGIVIEKAFQNGRNRLAEQGCTVHALARIAKMGPGEIVFAE
ncbi:MAG: xanthine phosphoribosyltransferase [Oscillospiraceae bacterium]|jgi:xanthine phosphoribosyltransferase|nr:xanthine phosphoribosyltransferase [Oscillospiraceae bacterium]